jgi:methionyl-tRNA synthetase
VLTGDYSGWVGAWQPSELPPGQQLREPVPLFKKLDESVVEEELARMRDSGAA